MNIAPVSMSNMAMQKASFKAVEKKPELVRTEEVPGGKVDFYCCDGKIYPIMQGNDEKAKADFYLCRQLMGATNMPMSEAEKAASDNHNRAKAGTSEG